ncbi:MAG TPA: AAA family ATPase, partial [Planctomycetota bacterium]|nr:AAA family ATPase [Planctomycetota bacterium]
MAIGDTTNLAARIQTAAQPGNVLVSAATLRLVPGLFVTESLGPVVLKGAAEAVELHCVRQQTGVRDRARLGTPTRLVGRSDELAVLLDRWQRAAAGHGQVVAISGEAGVGKSRLVRGLREHLTDVPHTWIDAECSPFASGAAFHPIVGLFARGLGFEQIVSPVERLAALERLQLPGLDVEAVVPYVAALLQLPPSERYPLPQQSAELQRERTLLALAAIYQALSRAQPVVFCIEDLHWSDPSTRELLERMAAEASAAGGLLLLTGRPEVWHERHLDGPHSTHIVLTRLSPGDARELATASLRGAALSEDVLEKVVARADGIPLFVEEL